jgi:cytidine deaminase
MYNRALPFLVLVIFSLIIIPLSADDQNIHKTGITPGSVTDEDLIRYSIEAQNNSYCPYSHYMVGAALLTTNGSVFTGANVENAVYGLSVTAAEVAVYKAVSEGEQKFSAIAVTSSGGDFAYPCGSDRQIISEFGLDARVIVSNGTAIKVTTIRDLLPNAFGPSSLA